LTDLTLISRMPRKKNRAFEKLGFVLVKKDEKYEAYCEAWNRNLKNTAEARLTMTNFTKLCMLWPFQFPLNAGRRKHAVVSRSSTAVY
jgi:hypothetical protein